MGWFDSDSDQAQAYDQVCYYRTEVLAQCDA
jgi:hypothetical protein